MSAQGGLPVVCEAHALAFADVVKVRLMNDKKHEFRGAFDCIRQVLAREGPFGFYKGFGMCWARVSVFPLCVPLLSR